MTTTSGNGNNASVEQWFFKERKELLANLRNVNKLQVELEERKRYISFAESLCRRLALHAIPTCTALLLLHRVLLRLPPTPLPATYDLAATLVFLALKVEETPRPLLQILQHALSERFSSPENLQVREEDGQVVEMRQRVLDLERKCLVLLCFDLVVDNPYRHLQRFFAQLAQLPQQPSVTSGMKQWREDAVERMHRSYYSLVHLEVSSRLIAGACIHASRPPKMEIPHELLVKLFKLESVDILARIDDIIIQDFSLLNKEAQE